MAKITIVGDAVVLTSALKLEDIKTIMKYRPNALVLHGGEDDKEEIFRLGATDGHGSITPYGIEFGSATRNDEGYAMLTMVCSDVPGDIKEYVADKYGAAVVMLSKLEDAMSAVLEGIAADKAVVMSHITVSQ